MTASKEGYNTAALPLRTSVDGWYWGNFLFGGLIGFLIVDPVTGAMFKVNDPKGPIALTETAPPVSNHGEKLIQLRELREQGILSEAEYQSKKKAIVSEM